jgi:hypothetical protein
LDLFFSPAVYSSISNPVASSAVWTEMAQPNNPPGSVGYLGIDANNDNTVATGPFRINVTLAAGEVAGPQQYSVSQFDQNGNFIGIIASESGITTPVPAAAMAPEPAGFALTGLALALLAVGCARRYRFGNNSVSSK